jgi:hypothetical protein
MEIIRELSMTVIFMESNRLYNPHVPRNKKSKLV